MASKIIGMAITMVLMTVLWVGATAQSSDCTNALISMSPCLNYITGNSSTPSSGCCTQLASVVRSKPECLCQVLSSGGSSLGIAVNQTQAEALPNACNVQTPPLSNCNTSTTGSPAGAPESPTTPSVRGPNSPSTDNGASDGSSTRLPIPLLFFLLLVASYASNL